MAKADLQRSTEQIKQINESLIDLNEMKNDYQDKMSNRRRRYEDKVTEMENAKISTDEVNYNKHKNDLMVLFHQYKEIFNEQRDRYHSGPEAHFRQISCLKNFIKQEIYKILLWSIKS